MPPVRITGHRGRRIERQRPVANEEQRKRPRPSGIPLRHTKRHTTARQYYRERYQLVHTALPKKSGVTPGPRLLALPVPARVVDQSGVGKEHAQLGQSQEVDQIHPINRWRHQVRQDFHPEHAGNHGHQLPPGNGQDVLPEFYFSKQAQMHEFQYLIFSRDTVCSINRRITPVIRLNGTFSHR